MALRTSLIAPAILLGCLLSGCGEASRSAQLAHTAQPASTSAARAHRLASATVLVAHSLHGLRGDEDDDDVPSPTMGTNPLGDADGDPDNDRLDNRGRGYYDGDDAPVRGFGHGLSPSRMPAPMAVARHYLELAAASAGAGACSLLAAVPARAAPRYGQVGGPAYLSGANGCGQVLTRLFAHSRGELTGRVEVTAVRVAGTRAEVLLGSRAHAATYLALRREAGAWRVDQLLPAPLP